MSDLPPAERSSLEAENQVLRREVARLQAERYQQDQVRFRTVFEHSPMGNKIIDADLVVRQANAAVATMLGFASALHLVGHRILDFAHPAYAADWTRLQEQLWAHHLPWFALETCLVRQDGSQLWCRVTSVLFPDQEGESGYTTLEDISARHQLETQVAGTTRQVQHANEELAAVNEELRVTNEELHAANTTLGQLNTELDTFVYVASHDLRLPIANLEGLMQALQEQLPRAARQAAQVEPILGMMQESVARFRGTLDRLADFSVARLEAALPREAVLLAPLLDEVRQEVALLLATTGGELRVALAPDSTVWFAAKHVHSVVLNLVTNALKYRHPDRAPVVQVRSYREAGRLVVRVQDNGLGLSETQQSHLFRAFKRLHHHVEGTGMGLYLVKKILDNAGGSIRVESELGQGSTFIVFFPA